MSISNKVNGMAFSSHAEALRGELAKVYIRKAIEWIDKKKVTSPDKITSLSIYFFRKAREEYESRLNQDFPDLIYKSYIDLICLGSIKFFDRLQEQIYASATNFLTQKNLVSL